MKRIQSIIAKKRDGGTLDGEEIRAFVEGARSGSWADYQLSALLMAIFLRGMDAGEVAELTRAMMHSGDVLDLSSIDRPKVDKHSTGGVGDKVSIPLAPLVASCGVAVPMISGRGLGHTGGTLDKLESIPGFRTDLDVDAFRDCVQRHGLCLIGQTDRLAPADRKLYALRDVTSTVESLPLIVSSILSKKLAEGIDALVLDVKVGSGAFLPSDDAAQALAHGLVAVASAMGVAVTAYLTDMDQPLGHAIGNALEVRESLDVLHGRGPQDLVELTCVLGAEMLVLGKRAEDLAEGRRAIEGAIASGRGLETFQRLIEAQGGDPRVVDDPLRLPKAPSELPVRAERSGYFTIRDARAFGLAALDLGAGRRRAEDPVDPAVGIRLLKKDGDPVQAGETLYVLEHAGRSVDDALATLAVACEVVDVPREPAALVRSVLRSSKGDAR